MTFNMVLHELTTNAAKHGALSVSGGSVDAHWRIDQSNGDLVFNWKERGGPPVVPPTRRGFGTIVIERSLRYELHGSGVLTYAPDGLACEAVIPAAHVIRENDAV